MIGGCKKLLHSPYFMVFLDSIIFLTENKSAPKQNKWLTIKAKYNNIITDIEHKFG